MPPPPIPADEVERLKALKALHMLDTPIEERFDRITRIAKRAFSTPIAIITFVDANRQWFKSCQGLEVSETSRAASFCGYAILQDDILLVPDAKNDPRFMDGELVTGPPFIRFYAGQSIKSPQNYKVGTLCVIDTVPRKVTEEDINTIRDLAYWVERELASDMVGVAQRDLILQLSEAKRKALLDPLTRLWNRDGVAAILERTVKHSRTKKKSFAIALLDLDHFKVVNDTLGHPVGDKVLVETAQRLLGGARGFDAVGRYGGEEFLVVIADVEPELAGKICERILKRFQEATFDYDDNSIPVLASIGCAMCGEEIDWDTEKAIENADKALYRAKKEGRNRVVIWPGNK